MKTRIIAAIALALLAMVFLASCEINRLNSARDHYNNKRYATAIQELDAYIRTGNNGAIVTQAEKLRGDCYYELGLMAMQRENWELAIRFLKLANTDKADEALGSIYKELADEALSNDNPRLSLEYVNAILREIPQSILTAEMVYRRIGFRLDTFIDHALAWDDYKQLYRLDRMNELDSADTVRVVAEISKLFAGAPGQAVVEIRKKYYNTFDEAIRVAASYYGNQADAPLQELLAFYANQKERVNTLLRSVRNDPPDPERIKLTAQYRRQARQQIDRIVPNKIEYARNLYTTGFYEDGLKILDELGTYGVVDADVNNRMMADAYIGWAESYLKTQNYLEADKKFREAVKTDPAKRNEVNRRLEQVVALFIQKGNELVAQREFDNALLHYQKTFDIIPDYAPALQAITRLNTLKANIAQATELYNQALKSEGAGKYAEARNLYRQAGSLDGKQEYSAKATQMDNLVQAEANPVAFAQRIINEYRGGVLTSRIMKKKQELLRSYNKSEVGDSGWKISVASGQYKYEARYDLTTPTESFYYLWQVNLKDRQITPLNKLSESLMR